MGNSANAYLAYGYNLGGGNGWSIAEADEYGTWDTDWHDGSYDFWDKAEERLRNRGAAVGVDIDRHCTSDYPEYMLITHKITGSWGDAALVDLAELQAMPAAQGWDDKLREALQVLGMTPKQAEPRWLLVAYWG